MTSSLSNKTTLPLPSYYDPNLVGDIWIERGDMVQSVARDYARDHNILPAKRDGFKIGVFAIDTQIGFITPAGSRLDKGASLMVPGAVEDTRRTAEWIYHNLDKITGLHFSMDTHRIYQIFHPAFWTDENGDHPAPLTPIFADEVRSGKWTPLVNPPAALEYCESLEKTGKYVLCIWPLHTLLGGVSHALEPTLMEAAIFHAVARKAQTNFETKGTHMLTENYSVLEPEVKELRNMAIGQFNTPFFDSIIKYDRLYILGQARTHCVMESLNSIRRHLIDRNETDLASKIFIVTDAMSDVQPPPIDPLPDHLNFPKIADEAFEECRQLGMNFTTTSDIITV